jgi:vacuolar-type H+-ATPase subunit H
VTDAIERLLEVEKRARAIIAEAEMRAADEVSRARERAREILDEGRAEAREEAQALVDAAIEDLLANELERTADEQRKLPPVDAIDPERMERAVREIVRAVAPDDRAASSDD